MDERGHIAGAVSMNLETQEMVYIKAKSVVIATGGSGRLHFQGFPTTNHYGATADGLVIAYRVGAPLAFIDTMQYHPTGAAFPEQILGQLVTEKVRGLGAQDLQRGRRAICLSTRDARRGIGGRYSRVQRARQRCPYAHSTARRLARLASH